MKKIIMAALLLVLGLTATAQNYELTGKLPKGQKKVYFYDLTSRAMDSLLVDSKGAFLKKGNSTETLLWYHLAQIILRGAHIEGGGPRHESGAQRAEYA